MTLLEMLFVLGCAALAATLGMLVLTSSRKRHARSTLTHDGSVSFLFRDCDLEHATPAGNALLSSTSAETDWHALRAALAARFPEFPDDEAVRKATNTVISATDPGDTGVVERSCEDEMIRVDVRETNSSDSHTVHTIRILQSRNATLELAAEAAPYPIWTTDADGQVNWHNARYDTLLKTQGQKDSAVPLFDVSGLEQTRGGSVRSSIPGGPDANDTWFDVTLTKKGGRTVCHAVDINAVIQAEIAQRNFVQTLAKTFAQLSIGLAIFDRNGQLALFNPAMVDLTSLPVEFLSGRPELLTFFDRLRDNRVMPEPKNYRTWRHEITDLIAAASKTSYEETWTLDSGQTYRISGRPHPDGAVAFLIEDITAEISLTRNFRAELELGQSMMDNFDDALAVFSTTSVLTFCNSAFRSLWKMDPEASFADITIHDCQKTWQEACAPNPAFGDIRDFVLRLGERTRWETELTHNNGDRLAVLVCPIAAGATMVRFTAMSPASIIPQTTHS
ncbi:MAG: PAS-domain containing protein [Pseudomonadota bacterium]